MKEKKLSEALGWIRNEYLEEMLEPKSRKTISGKLWMIAAVICLGAALLGCAIVSMRLQNLTVDIPAVTDYWGQEHILMSFQGFEGSKNYEATQEWIQFLETYDLDKAIFYASNDFETPDAYDPYFCYSQEMVNKLEEICRKYELEPLGKPWHFRQVEHIFQAVGIESVFTAKAITRDHIISGYCFRDGTFDLEGEFELTGAWNQDVGFGMRSVQKTSFDDVIGSLDDAQSYDQWDYTMDDDTCVLLVLRDANGEKTQEGMILVDKGDCFVVVSVHGPLVDLYSGIPNDRAFMEAFCEAFDFSYTAQQVDPDQAYALQCKEKPHTYAQWIAYLLTDDEQSQSYPDLTYALLDINGDGQEELLLRCGHHDFTQQKRDEHSFCSLVGMQDGELVHLITHGVCYLCEENVIEYLSPFETEPLSHTYERYVESYKPEWVDYICYKEDERQLYRQVDGQLVEITQAEADAVVSQYRHVEIEFKPAKEFQNHEAKHKDG